ncbi:hypothetical protein B0H13DRAFT_2336537 [Mycena leptocephala]|nr:hypothetical protein B0H13DRAFT_2336537 [Mycena leptocephala]
MPASPPSSVFLPYIRRSVSCLRSIRLACTSHSRCQRIPRNEETSSGRSSRADPSRYTGIDIFANILLRSLRARVQLRHASSITRSAIKRSSCRAAAGRDACRGATWTSPFPASIFLSHRARRARLRIQRCAASPVCLPSSGRRRFVPSRFPGGRRLRLPSLDEPRGRWGRDGGGWALHRDRYFAPFLVASGTTRPSRTFLVLLSASMAH